MNCLTIFFSVSLSLVTVIPEVYGDAECEKDALDTYFDALLVREFNTDHYWDVIENFRDGIVSAVDFAAQLSKSSQNEINVTNITPIADATKQLVSMIEVCRANDPWQAKDDEGNTACSFVKLIYEKTGADGVDDLFKKHC